MIIHLGDALLRRSSGLPGNAPRQARAEADNLNNASLFGLAPQGVCLAERVTTLAGEPLPHRFTIARHAERALGCLFSVALFRRVTPPGR